MDLITNILLIIIISILLIFTFLFGKYIGKIQTQKITYELIQKERKDAVNKSRAILKGQFSEQLSPFNEDFPAKPSECKFIGAPIDFIAFKGLDEKNVTEIIFIEIKTGTSKLNQTEQTIKNSIKNKNISFKEYRI